jgi:hypothetical protein
MNFKQKLYDSNDSTSKLDKLNNNSLLSRNLNEIRNRKPIYINKSVTSIKKKNNNQPNYERIKDNLLYNKILLEIRNKVVKPYMNTEQNEIINNNINSRKNYHKLNVLSLKKENESFRRRLNGLKPFISAKDLEKEYNERIKVYRYSVKRINDSLVLPPIKSY